MFTSLAKECLFFYPNLSIDSLLKTEAMPVHPNRFFKISACNFLRKLLFWLSYWCCSDGRGRPLKVRLKRWRHTTTSGWRWRHGSTGAAWVGVSITHRTRHRCDKTSQLTSHLLAFTFTVLCSYYWRYFVQLKVAFHACSKMTTSHPEVMMTSAETTLPPISGQRHDYSTQAWSATVTSTWLHRTVTTMTSWRGRHALISMTSCCCDDVIWLLSTLFSINLCYGWFDSFDNLLWHQKVTCNQFSC